MTYYFNVWDAQKFPFMSNSIFQLLPNGTSIIYPQRQVLGADNVLNQTTLEEIGRPHYSTVAAVNYVFINFAVTASITHIVLFHGGPIGKTFRTSFDQLKKRVKKRLGKSDQQIQQVPEQQMDPHLRMMSFYKEVRYTIFYSVLY